MMESANHVGCFCPTCLEQAAITEARLYLVTDALARLLAFVDRIAGYSEPDDQAAIRAARIALAEVRR